MRRCCSAYIPDPGHVRAEQRVLQALKKLGFVHLPDLSVGLQDPSKLPTAAALRARLAKCRDFDFSDYDALVVVIGSHGDAASLKLVGGAVARREIYSSFECPMQNSTNVWPTAADTLLGKPKVFLDDSCRIALKDQLTIVPHPQRDPSSWSSSSSATTLSSPGEMSPPTSPPCSGPAVVAPIYDTLRAKDPYLELTTANGEKVTRYADFAYTYGTGPFQQAGIKDSGSNFLSSFCDAAEELVHNPLMDFVGVVARANDIMHQEHAGSGEVAYQAYPQCAELDATTLRKRFCFCDAMLASVKPLMTEIQALLSKPALLAALQLDPEYADILERVQTYNNQLRLAGDQPAIWTPRPSLPQSLSSTPTDLTTHTYRSLAVSPPSPPPIEHSPPSTTVGDAAGVATDVAAVKQLVRQLDEAFRLWCVAAH